MDREKAVAELENITKTIPCLGNLIKDIVYALTDNNWISTKKDLPYLHPELLKNEKTTKYVEVVMQHTGSGRRRVEVSYMSKSNFLNRNFKAYPRWYWNTGYDVLYWRPTPEPPEE